MNDVEKSRIKTYQHLVAIFLIFSLVNEYNRT